MRSFYRQAEAGRLPSLWTSDLFRAMSNRFESNRFACQWSGARSISKSAEDVKAGYLDRHALYPHRVRMGICPFGGRNGVLDPWGPSPANPSPL